MTDLHGKAALVTGAGHGQGRAHAVTLAEAGADVIALDICRDIEAAAYPMSTPAELEETGRLVEAADRNVLLRRVDVRDKEALADAVAAGKAFHTANVTIPHLIEQGTRGAIVFTGSTAALTSGNGWTPCAVAYGASNTVSSPSCGRMPRTWAGPISESTPSTRLLSTRRWRRAMR